MCDKAVSTPSFTIKFVSTCYKTQEMCDKVVNRCFLGFIYIPDRYKTQEMCDEAVDDSLAALKFIPDWFVTSKMLGKLDNALHVNDDILFYNEDSDKSHIYC